MLTHPLLPKLRQLKLSGMVHTLDVRAAQAVEGHLSPVEFLALLLDDELERRSQQRLARRLAQSGCDARKTLADMSRTRRMLGLTARTSLRKGLPPAVHSIREYYGL